jgi:death-on-curing protein
VIYLTLPELVYVAERAVGGEVTIRDLGLLESAAARSRARAFGVGAYRDLDAKAAALLHSLARNHVLAGGGRRLALAALIAFCGINGCRLTLAGDDAYDLVMCVAAGELDAVDDIAAILENATRPRW